MRPFSRILTSAALLGVSSIAYADTIEAGRDIEDQDIRALREWIDTRRQVSLKEIGGDLSLSGEVRTEFQSTREKLNGKSQRGSDPTAELPGEGFDIEVNLMFDFRTDRTWASVKIEFDDDAGVFSGTLDKIALERAYWGVRVINADDYTFDIEAGRRSMTTIFDSKIQFGSFFDGILFRYNLATEKWGDFYLHAGPFVINDRKNHYGYVGEVGLLNIYGTQFYSKLSLIDWDTKDYSQGFIDNRFRFVNMQGTLGYRFKIERIKKIGLFYTAFLWNFAARKLTLTNNERANWGGYIGVSLGQLFKQWDWAVDINYQIAAAQALPDFDASGIGLGNANRSGFYTKQIKTIDGGGPATRATAGGTTNYQGYSLSLDILLTDKLDMQQSWVQSWSLNDSIGPRRTYNQYELEFIYSW